MRSTKTRPMPAGPWKATSSVRLRKRAGDHCATDDHRRRGQGRSAHDPRRPCSRIRQCILDAAQCCAADRHTVLTAMCATLRETPAMPRCRNAACALLEWPTPWICSAGRGRRMFDRAGTPWPRRTSPSWTWPPSREGYNAQLSIAYISLINTVNIIAGRDQFLGRPIINVTDEGHHHEEPAARALRGQDHPDVAQAPRRLVLARHRRKEEDDLPKAAEPMLSMIEVVDLPVVPPDEVGKIARLPRTQLREALMLSARKGGRQVQRGRHPVKVDGSAVPRRAASLYGDGDDQPEEGQTLPVDAAAASARVGYRLPRGREDRPRGGHRTAGAGFDWPDRTTRCACLPSPFVIPDRSADRGDGAVASWMLLRAPQPAAEPMPLAAAGSKRQTSRPALAVWPCRCALHGGRLRRSGHVRTAGPTSQCSSAGSTPIPRWNWRWHHLPLSMHEPAATAGARRPSARARRADMPRSGRRWRGSLEHPWRRPGPAGRPALSRPHASHAGLSRQRAPRCRHPCPGGGSGAAGHQGDATLQLRDRQSGKDPPAARPVEGDALLSAIDLLAARQRTVPDPLHFPRHARPALPGDMPVAIDLQGCGAVWGPR